MPPLTKATQSKQRRIGPEERFLIIGLAVVCLLVGGLVIFPWFGEKLAIFSQTWQTTAIHYGYIGAFVSALVGNMTIVIFFPYTAVVFFLAAFGLNPIWLAICTGVGATIGELFGYFIGWTTSGAFARRRPVSYEAVRAIAEGRPKLVPTLLFIFGALPLPDDLILIPLGIIRYPVWKVITPTLLGKIVAALAITLTGRQAYALVFVNKSVTGDILMNAGVLVVIIVGMYVFLKIRWDSLLNRLVPKEKK
jgi:membrane protein YqaA with SNARE-associated domain